MQDKESDFMGSSKTKTMNSQTVFITDRARGAALCQLTCKVVAPSSVRRGSRYGAPQHIPELFLLCTFCSPPPPNRQLSGSVLWSPFPCSSTRGWTG